MKVGEIVRLKSGGPQMTVNFIVRKPEFFPLDVFQKCMLDNFPEYVTCKWWDADKFVSENFGLDAVEVVA